MTSEATPTWLDPGMDILPSSSSLWCPGHSEAPGQRSPGGQSLPRNDTWTVQTVGWINTLKWVPLNKKLIFYCFCSIRHFLYIKLSGVQFVLYTAFFAHQTLRRTVCALYGIFCTSNSQAYSLCSIRHFLHIKLSGVRLYYQNSSVACIWLIIDYSPHSHIWMALPCSCHSCPRG